VTDRAGLLGGLLPFTTSGAEAAADKLEIIQADVTHPVRDPDDPPTHDGTEPDPNGDPVPAALSRPHAGPAPARRNQTDDLFKLLGEFMTLPSRIAVAYWTMAMRAARSDAARAVPGPNGAAGEHRTGSADR
jgi:hypothetical protein